MLITAENERTLIVESLTREGSPARQAAIQASWLLEADLRGHPSHGLQRLPVIVERIRAGLIDPTRTGLREWVSSAALAVDGQRGLGPCVAMGAMEQLCDRTQTTGIALAAIRNANHLGILAPYVEHAASADLIGIALTTSEALVHPWAGRVAMVGTNPLAIAVPADPQPFVLDMATGAVSMGRVLDHRHRDAPLEDGWAIDQSGEPTIDPEAVAAISPFGGAKGYALGVALEVIVAALTSTALGNDVTGTLDTTTVCNKGDLLICIDPGVLAKRGWREPVSRWLDDLRQARAQSGRSGVAVPGDRSRQARTDALRTGIEISDAVMAQIEALEHGRVR